MSAGASGRSAALLHRRPRRLHPMAWWLWALGLAVCVSQTTNPVLLALVLAVLGTVVVSRRGQDPWARAFRYYLVLAVVVVAIRVVFRSASSVATSTPAPCTCSSPCRTCHCRRGQPASSWAGRSPSRARSARSTAACNSASCSAASARPTAWPIPSAPFARCPVPSTSSASPRWWPCRWHPSWSRASSACGGRVACAGERAADPTLCDRSPFRCWSMPSSARSAWPRPWTRGYGRSAGASREARRVTGALMIGGMLGLCLGAYGLVDGSTPGALGLPALIGGSVLCVTGLVLGGRRVRATRYRPDPWRTPEWLVALFGAVPAAAFLAGAGGVVRDPPTDPPAWPSAPLVCVLAILVAALPAVVAPPRHVRRLRPSRRRRRRQRRHRLRARTTRPLKPQGDAVTGAGRFPLPSERSCRRDRARPGHGHLCGRRGTRAAAGLARGAGG